MKDHITRWELALLACIVAAFAILSLMPQTDTPPVVLGTPTAPAPTYSALLPHVIVLGSATPQPTPTKWIIPPGATERPTTAPFTPRPTETSAYPAPATATRKPTATVFRGTATRAP